MAVGKEKRKKKLRARDVKLWQKTKCSHMLQHYTEPGIEHGALGKCGLGNCVFLLFVGLFVYDKASLTINLFSFLSHLSFPVTFPRRKRQEKMNGRRKRSAPTHLVEDLLLFTGTESSWTVDCQLIFGMFLKQKKREKIKEWNEVQRMMKDRRIN